jgi:CoA-transferase family III
VSASEAPAPQEAGALHGLRVLELTAGLAGSVAGMLLADLGADVVKVYDEDEVPNVTPGRRVWDRNKVGATIDRSRVESMGGLAEMVRRADAVLVGTADDIRGYDALLGRGLVPGEPAVWLVMPPYLLGETPWAAERASAGLLHAWLGTAWSQASYEDVPVEISYPLALYMQGIWAATMVVALRLGAERGRASGGAPTARWSSLPEISSSAGTPLMFIAPGGRRAHCPTIAATDARMGSGCSSPPSPTPSSSVAFALSVPMRCWMIPVSAGIPPVCVTLTTPDG